MGAKGLRIAPGYPVFNVAESLNNRCKLNLSSPLRVRLASFLNPGYRFIGLVSVPVIVAALPFHSRLSLQRVGRSGPLE